MSRDINVAQYRLLLLIREFDDRFGWAQWSFRSCAEWLAWRNVLTLSAAREKVRTAQALRGRPQISEAFACDGSLVPVVESPEGEPLSIGRKRRTVPPAILRALWSRDRGCSFPGCCNRRFVDAHPVRHWSEGGETSRENPVLLCRHHHRLVHEGGYSIRRDAEDRPHFRRSDGRVFPRCGYDTDAARPAPIDLENTSAEVRETRTRHVFSMSGDAASVRKSSRAFR